RAAGASQQQSGMAEDTVLERGEGMLDGGAPKPHGLGRGAGMHAVERVFVEQSGHQPLRSLGTARLQSATAAVGLAGCVLAGCVVDGLVLLRDLFALKRLATARSQARTSPADPRTHRSHGTHDRPE